MSDKVVFLIKLEVEPKDLVAILSNTNTQNFKNPIPNDSKIFCVDYNESSKKICLYLLSKQKGFKIEEDFADQYKNRIAPWDLHNIKG